MADGTESERTILKILNGQQSGAEVSLTPGDYALGSGPDDDIQLVDVSLRPGHLKLRVAVGKIQIAGGSGSFRTANGLIVAAGNQDWQEVEPLDVITAGTTRFALGPPTAKWSTIAEDDSEKGMDPLARAKAAGQARPRNEGGGRSALPWVAVIAALGFGGWYVWEHYGKVGKQVAVDQRSDVEILRDALNQFPFGRPIDIRREVDGTIYVNGYVETQVERRALANAIEKTNVAAYPRIWVLASLRNEIDNLIKSRQLALTSSVTGNGEVAIEGVVLDAETADKFVALLRDNVLGIRALDNRIRTARILLRDVERLGRQNQIDPFVLFRLDKELIEASGIVPTTRLDAWLAFMQSYSARFAKDIGLRSLVQVQAENGERGPVVPFVIGGKAGEGELLIDPEQIKSGRYDFNTLYGNGGLARPGGQAGGPGRPGDGRPGTGPRVGGAGGLGSLGGGTAPVPEAITAAAALDGARLRDQARTLIERWREGGALPERNGFSPGTLAAALNALSKVGWAGPGGTAAPTEGGRVSAVYLAALREQRAGPEQLCWPGARVTSASLSASLFWLDLLSVSTDLSLASFDQAEQRVLIDTAMNPRGVAACAAFGKAPMAAAINAASASNGTAGSGSAGNGAAGSASSGNGSAGNGAGSAKPVAGKAAGDKPASVIDNSLYMDEVRRNPEFVRFVVRDLPTFPLDITGVSIGPDRYVQTRDGRKLPEGTSLDTASRIASVSELGALVQIKDGNAVLVFDPAINWVASSRF